MSSTEIRLVARAIGRRFGTGAAGFELTIGGFDLRAGDTVAVAGPSGCGKSTFLGMLALALRPAAGNGSVLQMAGVDALALWAGGRADGLADLRAQALGFVPQTSALLGFLSLRANIALPQMIGGRAEPAYIEQLAVALRIEGQLDRLPSQVSVGQRQRAAIARALAHRPSIILADEPTASVHPSQADEIMGLLRGLAHHTGSALVITTHDVGRAQAAGFALALCAVDPGGASTTLSWPA